MDKHFWGGLGLGIIILAAVPLSAATNSGPINEPWPLLLSSEPVRMDPEVADLQARADAALSALLKAAEAKQAAEPAE
jgi:hypothetical protein